MRVVHTELSADDLARWRQAAARRDALDDNPAAFTQVESVAVHREFFEVSGEFYEKYEVPPDGYAMMSPFTGEIYWDD